MATPVRKSLKLTGAVRLDDDTTASFVAEAPVPINTVDVDSIDRADIQAVVVDQVAIRGIGDQPPPTYEIIITGLPDEVTVGDVLDNLEAQIRAVGSSNPVFPYDAADWDWVVDTANATFGGVGGDELTINGSGAIAIRVAYIGGLSEFQDLEDGVANSVAVSPVSGGAPRLANLPAQVIEQQQYEVRPDVVDPGTGLVIEAYDPAKWSITVESGDATMVGPNQDILQVGTTASGQVDVRATYTFETLDPPFAQVTLTIAAPSEWPDNEPPGMTQRTHVNGTSLTWGSGWQTNVPGGSWPTSRVSVVSDAAAKFGSAVQKRYLAGDSSGWAGAGQTFQEQVWKEVYTRLVFKYSSNWDFHSGGEKLLTPNSGNWPGISLQLRGGTVFISAWFLGMSLSKEYTYWLPIIPGSPPQSALVLPIQSGPYAKYQRGVYHTVEVWRRTNDLGVANGQLRFWLDGVEYTRFANIGDPVANSNMIDVPLTGREWRRHASGSPAYSAPGITTRMEVPMYWGGQGDTKQVNDNIQISEIYSSGRN